MATSAVKLGLQLMASPSSSTLFVRTASFALGLGFPVYLTFKALETKRQVEQEQWLVYWAVYGCFNVLERISDKLASWFPCYHHAKLALLMWLQLPNNYGVKFVYFNYMRPFLLKHQARLDRIVDVSRNELDNFVSSHQKEIQDVANFTRRCVLTAYKSVNESIRSNLHNNTSDTDTSDPVVFHLGSGREEPCQDE